MKANQCRVKCYPRNYEESLRFYQDELSFEVVEQWDNGPGSRGTMLEIGEAVLELLDTSDRIGDIRFDLSLQVEDVGSLWSLFKAQHRVVFALRDNSWGDTSFCIADPDDNLLTFFSPIMV